MIQMDLESGEVYDSLDRRYCLGFGDRETRAPPAPRSARMATYYFHLCDGVDVLLDPDGRELPIGCIEAAALTEARAIIAADVRGGHIHLDQEIEVRDTAGKVVHRIAFEDAVMVTHLAVRNHH
jgi:hypothetical protein